jgi:hypothetical protein
MSAALPGAAVRSAEYLAICVRLQDWVLAWPVDGAEHGLTRSAVTEVAG